MLTDNGRYGGSMRANQRIALDRLSLKASGGFKSMLWRFLLLDLVFFAGIVLFIVRVAWPWLAGILRANGLQGV